MSSPTTESESSMLFVGIFVVSLLAALMITFVGHKKFWTNLVVGSLLAFIGTSFLILEIIFLIWTPFRMLFSRKPPRTEAGLHLSVDDRKIVLFDGVPDPNLVNFLPYQDALANPHVSLAKLKLEFPEDLKREERISEEICVISGRKIFWGAESVMEVCTWMYFPFPVTWMVGKCVPRSVRNVVYSLVSRNRYDWFGTQDLERNFAKGLCPYIQVKKFMGGKDE